MIEVSAVQPTARELRAVVKAWPPMGILIRLPVLWLLLGYALTAALSWQWYTPVSDWIAVCQFATVVGFGAIAFGVQAIIGKMTGKTPTQGTPSDWLIDTTGVRIVNPLSEQFADWRVIVRVVEEKDRVIFAVTPHRNYVLPRRLLSAQQASELRTLIADMTLSGRLGVGLGSAAQ